MGKVNVLVHEVLPGDILAKDVILENGVKLASEGTMLNSYIKNKLLIMGVYKILVYRHYNKRFSKDYADAIYMVKEMLNDLSLGKNIDRSRLKQITSFIFSSGEDYSNSVKYLYKIQSFDEYTYTHSINTAFYAMLIARWIGLDKNGVEMAIKAGVVHDVGKVHISEHIIKKQGKLTDEEFETMKKHPLYGYIILRGDNNTSEEIRKAVLMHHERTDGSGYPFGVKNDDISLYARIISIADVYDAITSDRVYKKKSTPFKAFEFLLTKGLGIFDVHMVNMFLTKLSPLYMGSKVLLSNGQVGEIVYVPPQDILNPIISVHNNYVDLAKEKNLKITDLI